MDGLETVTRSPSTVLSRHTSGLRGRWVVEARNANAWCGIPGNPFAPGFLLVPNPPALPPVTVEFGPFELPRGIDTFTFFAVSDRAIHRNTLEVGIAILDGYRKMMASSTSCLRHGDEACSTLTLGDLQGAPIRLSFSISFHELVDASRFGTVEIRYALGYARNPLSDLFNAAGSDKGTAMHYGLRGVPHCYSLDYYRIFGPFRDEAFNLLEIGLQNNNHANGGPTDAPSLRAWREFFPNATVYGYDIDDFAFFSQEATFTFQGDQSARPDIQRFLDTYDSPRFRLVVDDGSHVPSHQQISLAALFPSLEPGGLYVIEDLGWQPYPETPRTIEVLEHRLNGAGLESPFMTEAEARELETSIERIEIFKPNDSQVALIRKRPNEEERAA